MIEKNCTRNKISTEKNFGKSKKKKFRKNFHDFFFLQKFSASDFFSNNLFSGNIFSNFFLCSGLGGERSEQRGGWRAKRAAGGVGEWSEPPAGGLAVGAEGSVNSE